MTIEQVNVYELQSQIEQSVSDYGQAWNDEWKKLFINAREKMSEELNKSISDFEKQIMSASFNDVYYRNLIDRALDELQDNRELSIGGIISEYQRQGDDIAGNQFSPYGTDDLKESEVGTYLKSSLREHNKLLISSFRNLADSVKADVEREINKNLQGAVDVIERMKTSFADNLKSEGEEYLSRLEKDLSEKTEVLKKIDLIISNITELSNLYK
jgi:F0F1-type ATP synthase membrane subunit b/b'